ncbi:MAG TPA: bifunctional pyr operon transcriptional regulator/uracil phosphoribosyltransferase PyrR [Ruminiclostridium sp.]|nr:bifunctional pyr operon transcriptional regulator/uracil phosphoribosyltransferase PyrR [Ruminiclostridium sp.]
MRREKAEIMDEKAIFRAVARIAYEIVERNHGAQNLCVIGIKRRGAVLARLVSEKIIEVEGTPVNLGILDITPFRDDLGDTKKINDDSEIPFDVENKNVVLVDDVIFTGRSVRAAIDAIMNKGRPKRIQLAVLVDRGHRELPIRADFVGKNVPTSRNESVEVMVTEYDGVNRVAIYDNGSEGGEYSVE